jgi:hypothetical protein
MTPQQIQGNDLIQALVALLQQSMGMAERPPPKPRVFPSTMVSVYNSGRRPRIIYPMATDVSLYLAPGEKQEGVRMALHVIDQLREQGAAEMKLDPHSLDQPLVIAEEEGGVMATAVLTSPAGA